MNIRDQRFSDFLQTYCPSESYAPWPARFVSIEDAQIVHHRQWQNDHLVGTPSMNGLAKQLALHLEVALRTNIIEIRSEKYQWWLVDDKKNDYGPFDWVVCSAPVAQTRELLPKRCSFIDALNAIEMHACYTLMLGFDTSPIQGFDAAHVSDDVISWVSCNHTKPGRVSKPALVINSTNAWADKNIELARSVVTSQLLTASERILHTSLDPSLVDLQRWRYANISAQKGPEAYIDAKAKIVAMGDWCIKGRVESAFLSAWHVWEFLHKL